MTLVEKLFRFQVHNFTTHPLYILCVHHPKWSLLPSPFIPPLPHITTISNGLLLRMITLQIQSAEVIVYDALTKDCTPVAYLLFINPCISFKDFTYLCLHRGEGRERGRETSVCGCLSWTPTGDLACNPGMCPDWESNWRPFGSQAGTQSPEPPQPGLHIL